MAGLSQEMHQQPESLERFLEEGVGEAEKVARAIGSRKPAYIYLVARGSSANAGLYARYLLGERNDLVVCPASPSLYTSYHKGLSLEGAAVLAISQSGQSPDICEVVSSAKSRGLLTIAITNDNTSPLGLMSDYVISLRAEEKSIAATQTYLNSLAAVAAISACLPGAGGDVDALRQVPDQVREALVLSPLLEEVARRWKSCSRMVVLGRGYNISTANEIALKVKELSYVLAHPYSTAEFKHGPIAVIEPGFPVVLVGFSGAVFEDAATMAKTLAAAGADILLISDVEKIVPHQGDFVKLCSCPEWLSPMAAVIPGQMLAFHLSRHKGIDCENLRGLKKVTRTT